MGSSKRYLSADEAAGRLGVSKSTLYAYVSRGLVRSEAAPGASRRRKRYRAEDVRRLEEKQALRRDPSRAARSALSFGLPVLESELTLIEEGRFYYRGHDACQLAREARPLGEVAALLWLGSLKASLPEGRATSPEAADLARAVLAEGGAVLERFQAVLPLAAQRDERAYDLSRRGAARTGTRLLHLMRRAAAGGAGGPAEAPGPFGVAEAFEKRWELGAKPARPLLRAAMTLCADHELNVTAMAARCAASAGATPYEAAGAGLAALRGRLYAGGIERVEALLREAGSPEALRGALAARMRREEREAGFGHHLYPAEGDPRASVIAELLRETLPSAQGTAFLEAAFEAGPELLGRAPTVDFALVALRRALSLPPEAPLVLFATGRLVGWVAHAAEQYAAEEPIRPRATYVGPRPSESGSPEDAP